MAVEYSRINQAHWFGDIAIVAALGMSKAFEEPVSTLQLTFAPGSVVEYYTLEINPSQYQGAGAYLAGVKKIPAGAAITINYDVTDFEVIAYNSSDVAIASGEVGYMGFLENNSVASYTVLTP